jgi:hypothetical protein
LPSLIRPEVRLQHPLVDQVLQHLDDIAGDNLARCLIQADQLIDDGVDRPLTVEPIRATGFVAAIPYACGVVPITRIIAGRKMPRRMGPRVPFKTKNSGSITTG